MDGTEVSTNQFKASKNYYFMAKGIIVVDYLIILSIVLILGLVVLALFDVFPDYGKSLQTKQSVDYWQNQASPITVPDSYLNFSSGRVYLALTSRAKDKITIKQIIVNSTELAFFEYDAGNGLEGADLCDLQTCRFANCACAKNISAFSSATIVTEFYANDSGFCDRTTKYRLLPIKFIYSSVQDENVQFEQESPYPLALKCN